MTALARPQNGRMIGGVCAALARRFGTSATTMRVIFLVFAAGTAVPDLPGAVAAAAVREEGDRQPGLVGRRPYGLRDGPYGSPRPHTQQRRGAHP
jgi:phage shock protein PspC (stress-responsive transcriptional regulator)